VATAHVVHCFAAYGHAPRPDEFGVNGRQRWDNAVGTFGKGLGGWGIVPISNALGLIVASTAWKPAAVESRIEPRKILNHDVIDGTRATRFSRRFAERIESGYGLDKHRTLTAIDTEPAALWPVQVLA